MAVLTLEGVVEAGQIRLLGGERLPERATVYVVVPNYPAEKTEFPVSIPPRPRLASPRLTDRQTAARFATEMTGAQSPPVSMLLDTGTDITLLGCKEL
jgi:hypothetical protein